MRNYVEEAKSILRSGTRLRPVDDVLDLASEAPADQAEEILKLAEEHDRMFRRGAFVKYFKRVHGVDIGGLR